MSEDYEAHEILGENEVFGRMLFKFMTEIE